MVSTYLKTLFKLVTTTKSLFYEMTLKVQTLEVLFPVQKLEKTVQVLCQVLPWYFTFVEVVSFSVSD